MVSLVVWGKRPDINASAILGDTIAQFSSVHKANTLEQVVWLLQHDPEARMVLFIGNDSIVQMLPSIQKLHTEFPRVSVIAIPKTETAPRELNIGDENEKVHYPLPLHAPDPRTFGGPYEQQYQSSGNVYDNVTGYHLTPRQKDVLELITNGKSNKEIARQLGMTEGTVKIHCMAIFRTLHVTNRTQAAMVAKQLPQREPSLRAC